MKNLRNEMINAIVQHFIDVRNGEKRDVSGSMIGYDGNNFAICAPNNREYKKLFEVDEDIYFFPDGVDGLTDREIKDNILNLTPKNISFKE